MSDKTENRIVFLVGNGFDISALRHVNSQYTTSYESFYYFLKMSKFNENNLLLKEMDSLKNKNVPNWSNFEAALEILYDRQETDIDQLEGDLNEIQIQFSKFLNLVVNDDVLESINQIAEDNQCGSSTYGFFLGDLSKRDLQVSKFMRETTHHQKFIFDVFNFNYTSLLDNFLYLGRKQFEPHPFSTVDNNFGFFPNPCDYDLESMRWNGETRWSCKIESNLYHPHGYQDIPRSMLFGFDRDYRPKEAVTKFLKPYWGQNDKKYSQIFEEADLFLVYGMSIGKSDRWWWREVCDSIFNNSSELIIYCYSPDGVGDDSVVKDLFIESAGLEGDPRFDDLPSYEVLTASISVVFFNSSSENYAFTFTPLGANHE